MSPPIASRSGKRRFALCAAGLVIGLLASHPVFAAYPPASSRQDGGQAVDKLLADAQKALAAGDMRLALIYLKNAVSLAPGNTTARIRLGSALLQAGDPAGSERELRQARKDGAPPLLVLPPLFQTMLARNEGQMLLDLFPDPGPSPAAPEAADILRARALALQALKRGPEATSAINRSLQLRRDGVGLLTAARLSLQQRDFGAATRFVDEAVRASPDDPDALLFKVEMLLASQDNTAALAMANRLTSQFPASLSGRFARVETLLRLHQDAQAKAEIDSLLAKNPGMQMAIYYKALLIARAGDIKGAWAVAQALPGRALDTDRSMSAMVAEMAIGAGDVETGASMLARLLRTYPQAIPVRIRLAELRLRQNGTAGALNILRPLKDSKDPRVLKLYSIIYLQTHRPREALDALRNLNAERAAGTQEKRALALLELQMGNADKAIEVLSQAVAREPTNPVLVQPYIDALIQQRKFAEALKAADKLGSDPKQQIQALAYRGTILMLQHNEVGAQAAFDKAVALDPRSKAALFSRATFLVSLQKYPQASSDLKAILSLDDKDLAATMKLAEVATRQGDDPAVRALYNQAMEIAPKSAAPKLALTRYLVSRRDLKGAQSAANSCLQAQPSNDDCVFLLARIQSQLGQKKEAAASFRRLVSLRPNQASAQLLLSAALSLVGDRAGAGRALDTAAELDPRSETVKRAQINFQIGAGKLEAAVSSARYYQHTNPGPVSDLMLAETLERAKNRDEAIAVLNKSLSAQPNRVILSRLVQMTLAANDKKRAGELFSKWLAVRPADIAIRMEYAAFLLQRDDMVKALAQYQIVLKQEPDNIDALNNAGWLLQRSDPARALSLLTRAAKLAPNSANVADTLGWFKLQQKDAAAGLALLQRAHALEPGNGQITYHLAIALDANGQRGAARDLLKPLLAGNASFKDRPAAAQLVLAWR